MRKYIEKLHFITHDFPGRTHVEQAEKACAAGAKWIQYRCFSKPDDALIEDITAIGEICDDWGATLIVTDHIRLAGQGDIQGFHIEDMSADFTELRRLLGDEYTLGGSANQLDQVERIFHGGADYVGVGPFTISHTKPNNFPQLAASDYLQLMDQLMMKGIEIPVLAVGGVRLEDVPDLMQTGIFGVAVSNAINSACNFEYALQDFKNLVEEGSRA